MSVLVEGPTVINTFLNITLEWMILFMIVLLSSFAKLIFGLYFQFILILTRNILNGRFYRCILLFIVGAACLCSAYTQAHHHGEYKKQTITPWDNYVQASSKFNHSYDNQIFSDNVNKLVDSYGCYSIFLVAHAVLQFKFCLMIKSLWRLVRDFIIFLADDVQVSSRCDFTKI